MPLRLPVDGLTEGVQGHRQERRLLDGIAAVQGTNAANWAGMSAAP